MNEYLSENITMSDVTSVDGQLTDKRTEDPYEMDKCVKWIEAHNLEKVCLQFPDDLLSDSVNIALHIEKYINRKVYILGDTTCGSCCVDIITAQHANADGIIHFGHACLNPVNQILAFHVLPKKSIDVTCFQDQFKEALQDTTKKCILFYDVAYAHLIECIYNNLKPIFKNLILSTLNCKSNVEFTDSKDASTMVVLGRRYILMNDTTINDYEAVFLGENGKTFSTLAMSIPAKKWYYFENNKVIEFNVLHSPWLKRRRFLVEKLKDAKVVGIVVATLGIQDYLKCISMVKNILKEKNKKTYTLCVGKINPTKLANFPEIDAFIVIACSENEVFDSRDFLRPILMPFEVDLAFNTSRKFSTQYCMDFRQILPDGLNYCNFETSMETDVSLISGDIRNADKDILCIDKMDALVLKTPGVVAIGNAGAQFLQERSWKGVEQRLGKDSPCSAHIGRSGLASHYNNELFSIERKKDMQT
ncbi:2-(3-amino-3-carboxypropyl)histidine synthase subunit 2-like isoform X1 [Vespa mandarinia]|uniref:2-(3-amino-3-carboxypropyl)histidine synthase subunit 2-like isoform X1 n=2 Tax=Vespa mandarinia TaxID=7446 RepID=UPI00160D7A00|nr:2-(3-amino-3-carboxypropyl)histidine synthase subunit 2-like isoform X1 [Vespa mandarinia]